MMFQPSGGGGGVNSWAATSAYVVGDIVSYGKNLYICIVAHTAGSSFESDLIAGKWEIEVKQVKGVNLILTGSTFEDNSVGGWTASGCATVTNGFPASVGTGGAAFSSSNGGRAKGANTTNPAIVSSGQINGQYSLNFATSGAGTIGDMYISSAHPIPIKYQAKVLAFEIAFKVVSGTPVMGGTSSNTYAVAIYDPVNNSWIQPTGCFSFTQSSGVGIASGTFQVPYNSTSFQIAIYNPVAPTGASSLYIDDIWVGPQNVVWGVPVTDWVSYTPTFTSWGTTSNVSVQSRRVGDSLEVQGRFQAGTTSAATAKMSLGFNGTDGGLTIDSNKLNGLHVVGSMAGQYSSTTDFSEAKITATGGDTFITFGKENSTSYGYSGSFGSAFGNNGTFSFHFKVPVSGWSSNTIMSSDAATNVVAMSANTTTGQTLTGGYAGNVIIYTQKDIDTNSNYNTSTGIYTIPVSGYYDVSASISIAAATHALNDQFDLIITLDGAATNYSTYYAPSAGSYSLGLQVNAKAIYCKAGQQLKIVEQHQNASSRTLNATGRNAFLNIERISGPAQIAASETVAARYSDTSTTAFGNGPTTVAWGTKDYDSHNAISSNVFTAPISGTYRIKSQIYTNGVMASGQNLFLYARKNSSNTYLLGATSSVGSVSAQNNLTGGDVTLKLLAGETIDIRFQTNTAGNQTQSSASQTTVFEVIKVGNY